MESNLYHISEYVHTLKYVDTLSNIMLLLLTGAKQPWMPLFIYYIPFPSLGLLLQLKTDNSTAYISKYVI